MTQPKTHPVDGMMEIDFNSPDFQRDFKDIYAKMHASGCPFAHSTPGDHYAVGSYKELTGALLQPKLWRSKYGPGLPYQPEDTPGVLVSVDPPEHTIEARIAGKVFSKSYFDSFEPRIAEFIEERIDSFVANGACDIHAELSVSLPLFVIFEMFGIPLEGRADAFRQELKANVGFMLKPADLRGNVVQADLTRLSERMIRDHFAECREKVASGEWTADRNLVTRFMTTEVNGERLSDEKILGFCRFLLVAGSATTTILLSNVLYRLLSEPEQFAMVKANPSLIPIAIEEALRIDAPVQGLFRTNDTPTELGPMTLEADTKVMMLWAAANLDPEMFEDPQRFDITRAPNVIRKHVAFGHGIHVCRGAPLARMEAKVFLEALIRRLPNMRIGGEVKPELAMPVLQGIAEFPLAWDV